MKLCGTAQCWTDYIGNASSAVVSVRHKRRGHLPATWLSRGELKAITLHPFLAAEPVYCSCVYYTTTR
jgi:hypothetical protein